MTDARILIVEDELLQGEELTQKLKQWDYEQTILVPSGEAAIHHVRQHQPNLVLIDMGLQGSIDGVETARSIRMHSAVPIVYITKTAGKKDLERAKATEPSALLFKPIRYRELHAAIELALYKHHQKHSLPEEAKLRESLARERFLGDIIRTTSIAIGESYPDGRIGFVNPAAQTLTGYSEKELMRGNWKTGTPPEWQELEAEKLEELQRTKRAIGYEKEYIRKDGSRIPVELVVHPQLTSEGEVGSYIVFITDISERKRAEKALRESEARFRAIAQRLQSVIETVEDGITLSDESGYFEIFNSKMEELSGYTKAEANGSDEFLRLLYPDDINYQQAQFGINEIQRMSGTRDIETTICAKDGTPRTLLVSSSVIQYQERKWFLSAYRDISARKLVETEVLLLRNAIKTAKVGVTITGTDKHILYVNPAEAAMHGYCPEELIGEDARIFSPAECWRDVPFNQLEEEWEHESVNIRKDGSTFPVHTISTPVRDELGEPAGIIRISEDITDRKRVEIELQRAKESAEKAQKTAEAASRAKSEFLANMSHELRTPLNAIIGFSQLLHQQPKLNAEQQQYLSIINRNGEHLLTLINQVLDLAKIESGVITLNEKSFNLYRLLDDMEELFRMRAKRKQLDLSFTRRPDLPQYIRTDEVKLRQVLINIIGNALKFTQKGNIQLSVTSKQLSDQPATLKSSCYLLFTIKDTGPGIETEDLQDIFKAFRQTTSGRELPEGTGLGLTISRKFVQLMGGDMTLFSEVGHGTNVAFNIQVTLTDASTLENDQTSSRRIVALAPAQPKYRILLVDDNQENRLLFLDILAPVGFDIREAENGWEALELWERWRPHLIWMDLRMPGLDGYETTKRIRMAEKETTNAGRTVIIAQTASPLLHERAKALACGCDNFLAKPFRQQEIFDLMQKHLGLRYLEKAEKQSTPDYTTQESCKALLTPTAFETLPFELVTELEQASLWSDVELAAQTIEKIRSHNSCIADALEHLANNFAYDTILAYIQEAKHEN